MSSPLEAGLARLRVRFRERAARDAHRLHEIASDLNEASDAEGHRDELRRIAHGLLGTAATLGFAEIGDRARELEDAVLAGSGPQAWAKGCEVLARALADAEEEETVAPPPVPALVQNGARTVVILDRPEGGPALATMVSNLGYAAHVIADEDIEAARSLVGIAGIVVTDAVAAPLDSAATLSARAPVLLVTQDRSFEHRLAAARAGVDAVLSRPIDVGELADWLETFSENNRETPLSVMIVDDDRLVAEAHATALESAGMRASIVSDPETALERVSGTYPDLILLDMEMPGVGGIELARIIRQSRRHLSLPIMFLSAERDPALQLEARQIGGDDFIVKPVDPHRLISLVRMRAERAVQLRSMMERDSLTGLLNHARFKDRLAHELQRCRRSGAAVSLALIDLDHFKSINDTYGHLCGDRVIRALAHALTAGLRRTDIIGRYGGEEFGAILLDTKPEQAKATIEKVRRSFGDIEFDGGERLFSTTFSAGVAGSRDHANPEALIAAADRALYEAKRIGRNRTIST